MEYSVAIIGANGCGKSAVLERLLTGDFGKRDILHHSPIEIKLGTTAGPIKFICVESRQEAAACAASIVLFDTTSVDPQISESLSRAAKRKPRVLCGNKSDASDSLTNSKRWNRNMAEWVRENNIPFFAISAKSNYNIDKPFLYIARMLTGNDELQFSYQIW